MQLGWAGVRSILGHALGQRRGSPCEVDYDVVCIIKIGGILPDSQHPIEEFSAEKRIPKMKEFKKEAELSPGLGERVFTAYRRWYYKTCWEMSAKPAIRTDAMLKASAIYRLKDIYILVY